MRFDAAGRTLATADGNGEVRLWEVPAGRPLSAPAAKAKVLDSEVSSPGAKVEFSADGRLLSAGGDHDTVVLSDTTTGEQIGEPLGGKLDSVSGVKFNANGQLLATATVDNTIVLWRPQSGQRLGLPITGSPNRITTMAFGPDGTRLASASPTGEIRLWDPELYVDPVTTMAQKVGPIPMQGWATYAPDEPLPTGCP
jgi:WD40 repeat protein